MVGPLDDRRVFDIERRDKDRELRFMLQQIGEQDEDK